MIFTYDPADPLDRQTNESRKANSALRDYALMGGGRSLAKLLNIYLTQAATVAPPTRFLNTLKTWSNNYLWQERVAIYEQIKRAEDDVLWQDRRRELIEKDFNTANQLRDLSQKILDEAPRFLKSTRRVIPAQYDKDGVMTHAEQQIITVALDGALLVKLLALASELQHNAVGDNSSTSNLNIDVNSLTEDQLSRIANGENPIKVLAGK